MKYDYSLKNLTQDGLLFVGFMFIIGSVSFLAYDQGKFDGMSYFCDGKLIIEDKIIKCYTEDKIKELNLINEPNFDLSGYDLLGGIEIDINKT